MIYVTGVPVLSGDIIWQIGDDRYGDPEPGVRLAFTLHSFRDQYQRREALKAIERIASKNDLEWLRPGSREWQIDLNDRPRFGDS
jgi:hypothetical protein